MSLEMRSANVDSNEVFFFFERTVQIFDIMNSQATLTIESQLESRAGFGNEFFWHGHTINTYGSGERILRPFRSYREEPCGFARWGGGIGSDSGKRMCEMDSLNIWTEARMRGICQGQTRHLEKKTRSRFRRRRKIRIKRRSETWGYCSSCNSDTMPQSGLCMFSLCDPRSFRCILCPKTRIEMKTIFRCGVWGREALGLVFHVRFGFSGFIGGRRS